MAARASSPSPRWSARRCSSWCGAWSPPPSCRSRWARWSPARCRARRLQRGRTHGRELETVTKLHAVLAWIVVTLTFALWFVLKAVDAPRAGSDPHPRAVPDPARPGRHRLRPVLRPAEALVGLPACSAPAWCGSASCGSCCRCANARRPRRNCRVLPRNRRSRARRLTPPRTPAGRSPPRSGPPPAARPPATRRPRRPRCPAPGPAPHGTGARRRRAVRRPACPAGEQELEGGQLQDLGEDGRRPGSRPHQRGTQVGVDVREDPWRGAPRAGGTGSRAGG